MSGEEHFCEGTVSAQVLRLACLLTQHSSGSRKGRTLGASGEMGFCSEPGRGLAAAIPLAATVGMDVAAAIGLAVGMLGGAWMRGAPWRPPRD